MRIDLLLKNRAEFSYESYATRRIEKVFESECVPYQKIYLSDGILHDYLRYVEENRPHYLLSFHSLLPYQMPFCDFVRIPQLLWAKASLSEGAHFIHSQFGRVALPNPTPYPKTVHLPHGIDPIESQPSLFDVVIFSPLIDLACLRERWQEFFSEEGIVQIQEAVACGSGDTLIETVPPSHLSHVIEAVEEYMRAERMYRVITSARDYRLDLFGEHIGNNWYRRLNNAAHVHLHSPLPYAVHFEVLAQSKIVILDPLDAFWKLPAAAAGCLPLFADAPDLHEQIQVYLADSKKREGALEDYQEQIRTQTWEKQVNKLIGHCYES